jgi:2-polyprenyl-3-methyl-5-hydroxy-6-metoxy-1,4-benzoquinol methylase
LLQGEVEPGAKILEHGAAPFVLSQALTQAQYSVTAGDSDPKRFGDLSELPFDVVKHDVEKDSIEENFDAVIMNELFEHLRLDLVSTLQSVLSTLKPGGYLFLSTPNAASIEGIYNLIVYNTSYSLRTTPYHEWSKLDRIGHMGHVKEYTAGEVADFLTEVGFEDERIVYRNPHQRESANSLRDYFFSMSRRMFKGLNPLFSVVGRKPHVE